MAGRFVLPLFAAVAALFLVGDAAAQSRDPRGGGEGGFGLMFLCLAPFIAYWLWHGARSISPKDFDALVGIIKIVLVLIAGVTICWQMLEYFGAA